MPPLPTVWPIEDHTKAKHEILRRYLGGWFPILTAYGRSRVVYFDGFCGPGVYSKGEPGSPIVALNTLVTHSMFSRLNHAEFVFFFIDKDPNRCDNLSRVLTGFWSERGGQPRNVKVQVLCSEFVAAATSMLDELRQQRKTLAPTFALLDPFGWDIPLRLIGDLFSFDKCEVLISFMFDSINRFLHHPDPKVRANLEELFATKRFSDASQLAGLERKQFLHDLYRTQLHDTAGFDHVLPFEMVNKSGRTVYSLFYGTRSETGVRVMKEAMWGLDPALGLRFSDRLSGQQPLFGGANADVGPLRLAILERFAGRTVGVAEIEPFVLLETPYAASHYKTRVLKPLQIEGFVEAISGQNRRGNYPAGTVLRFKPRA